jgi:hypothetical protein
MDVEAFMSTAPGVPLRSQAPPSCVSESGTEASSGDDDAMSFQKHNVNEEPDDDDSSAVSSVKSVRRRPPRPTARSTAKDMAEKGDLLFKIERMRKRGLGSSRTLSLEDDLQDIQMEYARLVKNSNIDKSIAFQRSLLVSVASGMEYLNSAFDPMGIKLDGWSGHLNDTMPDYDDVLEELAEKWGSGPSNVPPELKLVFMLVSSGAMFHLQSTMFKSAPGMDEVMKENPELAREFAAATARSMAKSDKTSGPQKSMSKMMGSMFGAGNPKARVSKPDTHDIDELLGEEDLFSESSESAPGSIMDELEQELHSEGPIVMDI